MFYAALAIGAALVIAAVFLLGRAALRGLRAFVKSCWPQS